MNSHVSLREKSMGGRNQISKPFLEGSTSQPEKVMLLHSSTQIFISDDLGAQPAEATKQY